MQKDLLVILRKFFEKRSLTKSPLLLGFSGGPDSKILLHLLLKLREEFFFDLHVAHVDHSWRKESSQQALFLQKELEALRIPFHLKTLSSDAKMSELSGRKERIAFFKKLFENFSFQALLLGHHKDDLSETVFKRFLEGASLPFLQGMSEISLLEGMPVWRPLLSVSKKEILFWLQESHISYIEDSSNQDPRFLRARMRNQMFPHLTKFFGKEVFENFYEHSLASGELREYLDRKIGSFLERKVEGPLGVFFDLEKFVVLEEIEKKHLLRRIFQQEGLSLPRDFLEILKIWLEKRQFNKKIFLKNREVYVERGFLFLLKQSFSKKLFEEKLENKKMENFEFFVSKEQGNGEKMSSWQDVWKGAGELWVPEGEYWIKNSKQRGTYECKELKKIWAREKVPVFLRELIPILHQKGGISYEFLSGCQKKYSPNTKFLKVILQIK